MRKLFVLALLVFCLAPTFAQDEIMTFEPTHTKVLDLAISPSETQLVTISRSQTGQEQFTEPVLEVFSIETGEVLHSIEDIPIVARYNTDGSQLFAALRDYQAVLLDTETFEELVRVELFQANRDYTIQFSPDGSQLMMQTTSMRVHNAEDLSLLYELRAPSDESIKNASYSVDGTQIAMIDWNNTIYMLDAETGESVNEFSAGLEHVHYLEYLSDNTIFVTSSNGISALLDAETGDVLASYEFDFFVRQVAAREDHLLISNSNNEVLLWHPSSDEVVETFVFDTYRNPWQLAFGETLIFANEDQLVFATEYTLPEEE